jgi:hypothetical protein
MWTFTASETTTAFGVTADIPGDHRNRPQLTRFGRHGVARFSFTLDALPRLSFPNTIKLRGN